MTCREATDFLMDYLDGKLAAPVRITFEEHLIECPACVDYVESYRATITLAAGCEKDAGRGPVPEELIAAILAAQKEAT
jgi:anti-sigma factor RsiW